MALKLLHEKKTTDSCGNYLNNSSYAQFEGNGTIFILKKAFYLSVKLSSTKVLIGDTTFTSRTGDGTAMPFYVVFRATQRSSRLQCKGSTFIAQLF